MSGLSELESTIRDFINRPRKQHILLQDHADWYRLCSSLDVIGDTELALDEYMAQIENPANPGELYLILYGVLQILFVQQDAVQNMAEALGLDNTPDPLLQRVREMRNDSVGHPTKRGGGKGRSFNFITRISMRRSGFTLLTTYPDGRSSRVTEVDVLSLISSQRDALRRILNEVIQILRKEEMEHREKFKSEKLEYIFPQILHYYYEKIAEAIYSGGPPGFGVGIVEQVANVVDKFKEALDRRGILEAYNVVQDLELVEYPLAELHKYFESPSTSKLNDKDAYIFLVFIRKQIDWLIGFARGVDEDYSSEV